MIFQITDKPFFKKHQLPVDGHSGCFQCFAAMNNAVITVNQALVEILFMY
jgi:hypothetical protein